MYANHPHKKLKEFLNFFAITMFYTDDWGSYKRNLDRLEHKIGKINTQKIEHKNLTLRTRINVPARKTICFQTRRNALYYT